MNGTRDRLGHVLAGLFVIGLTLTFVAAVLWLGAGGRGGDTDPYLVYMQESVAGLSRDSVVKYRGVDVGRVREIGLDPARGNEVRLLLAIDAGTPVREDTVAQLETQGLTGLAFINLTGGGDGSPALVAAPGEAHPVIPSRPSRWGRLDRAVEALVADFADVSRRLKVLLDDDNLGHIGHMLARVDALATALAGRADGIATALDDMAVGARHLREAGAGLPALVARLQEAATGLLQMADEVRAAGSSVGRVVRARDRDLQRFTGEALPEATAMVNELRRAAENLRRFSEQLERDPTVLWRGGPPRPLGPGE